MIYVLSKGNAQSREYHMSIQRTTIVLASSAALFLAGAVAAVAHAHLVRATPAVGGTVHTPPSEVTLRFSEKLEAAFSSIVVRDSTGKQVDKADGTVDKGDRTLMRVMLQQPLAPGVYKVEWKAMSADTHKIDGDFTFKVGE
jgi:methionine-rich copper-binding protein CopC